MERNDSTFSCILKVSNKGKTCHQQEITSVNEMKGRKQINFEKSKKTIGAEQLLERLGDRPADAMPPPAG